jgi:hypothetical protein
MCHMCDSDIECCALLEAERYEIYPSHYYTRSSFRKQGHEEIGLSCILLKAVYGAVIPGSLYGDLLECRSRKEKERMRLTEQAEDG